MVEAREKFWQNHEMRLLGSACLHSAILCTRRVGGAVGLLGHVASR